MSEIISKFLFKGDKCLPAIHLKQPGFTYSPCGPFNKKQERIQKFIQTGNINYNYKTDLDKACFSHDIAHGNINI